MDSPKRKKTKYISTIHRSDSDSSVQEYTYLGHPNETVFEDSEESSQSSSRVKITKLRKRKKAKFIKVPDSDTTETDSDCIVTKVVHPTHLNPPHQGMCNKSPEYQNQLADPEVQRLYDDEDYAESSDKCATENNVKGIAITQPN